MQAKTNILNLPTQEFVHPGTRACTGCGLSIAYRVGLKALGKDTILVVPPSCLTVLQGLFPVASTKLPCLNVTFASTAAAATGILATLKTKGNDHTTVAGWAGDGGTSDIGLQALSGAAERGDNFIYFCYDNEGYMNTGVQRSGATPPAARTANTKPVGKEPGNVFGQGKNVPLIAMAHEIPYVATATVAEPRDLEAKVERAMEFRGARYIHVFVPCPLGWGSASQDTIRLARLVKETGLFPVFEAEHGEVTSVAKIRRRVPVIEYLKLQRRFAHLFKPELCTDVIDRLLSGASGAHPRPPITASAGVAGYVTGTTAEELLAEADRLLYQAKRAGRDRVVLFRGALPATVRFPSSVVSTGRARLGAEGTAVSSD